MSMQTRMLGFLKWIWGLQLMSQWILITVIPSVRSPSQSSFLSNQSPSQFSSGQYKFVTYVPINEEEYGKMTKNMKCEDSDHFPTFALHPEKKKTILGCFKNISVIGKKCLEYNVNQNQTFLQPKFKAPCENFSIKPCNFSYSSLKSYEILECFLIYGGIPSLLEQGKKNDYLEERETNMTQTREQENEESQINIRNLTEQIDKLNQEINEKNTEIENLQKGNLQLKICCGIFGGLIFIYSCIMIIVIRKLLDTECNTCRERHEAKNRDKSLTDSYNTLDTPTERDPLHDKIDTEDHREEYCAIPQISLTSMNDIPPESPDNDVPTRDSSGAALCDSSFSTEFNNTTTEMLDRNRDNQLHPMDTYHAEIDNEF